MKLVQLNVWGGRVDKPLRAFLKSEEIDILCGQEMISYDEGDSLLFFTLEEIKAAAAFKNLVFSPTISFSYMESKALLGNAILSNFEIVSSKTFFTSLKFTENFNYEEHSYNVRNFVHAVINCDGKLVNVITHQGHHVREHKNGNEETDNRIRQIAEYVSGLSGPVILTGDFNLSPTSSSLAPLKKMFTNLSVKYDLKTTRNSLTLKDEVCDYIFVSDDIQVNNFYMEERIISDHQALILDFSV